MKVTIIQGTVKFNDKVYLTGETVDFPDATAVGLLREGVAKPMQVVAQVESKKVVEKINEAKKEEVKVEVKVEEVEPTTDWTRKELNEYAATKGIDATKFYTKQEVVNAIKGVK